jgi:hypothetical protein
VIGYSFHPEARAELTGAADYYDARLEGLGATFIGAVERTIALVCQYPDSGPGLG